MDFLNDLVMKGLEFFGRYYSVYTGWVVENDDPDGINRLIVYIPEVRGIGSEPIESMPISVFSGKGFGTQLIPPIGSVVSISFRHGDPRIPLWNFGWYGEKEKPQEFKDITTSGFVSLKGFKVLLYEATDNPILTVETPGGLSLKISDETKEIEINNGTTLKITVKEKELIINGEHFIRGEELKKKLESLLDILLTPIVEGGLTTISGEIGFVNPVSSAKLVTLKNSLNSILTKY